MGSHTYIKAVRELDEGKFDKMIKLKLACDEAQVDYPQELKDYLIDYEESVDYIRKEMEEFDINEAIREYGKGSTDVIEIELSKLSKEVKCIRVITSY